MSFFHNISKNNDELSFIISNVHTSIVNSVRRILLSEIETYAFNEINIIKNTSILHDEFIKHRISLIPLNCDDNIEIELKVQNNDPDILDVTSNDIKIVQESMINDRRAEEQTTLGLPFVRDILLIRLKNGEELSFTAKTKLDIGQTHAKYQPVSIVAFKILKSVIHLNEKFLGYMDKIPSTMELENSNIIGFLDITDHSLDYNSEGDIEDFYFKKNLVYKFKMESLCQHPEDLFLKALLKLKSKLKNILQKKNYNIVENVHIKDCINVTLSNEKYTIGNILEYSLNLHENVDFIYYKSGHPFDDFIKLSVKLKKSEDDFINCLIDSIGYLIRIIDEMIENWIKIFPDIKITQEQEEIDFLNS